MRFGFQIYKNSRIFIFFFFEKFLNFYRLIFPVLMVGTIFGNKFYIFPKTATPKTNK